MKMTGPIDLISTEEIANLPEDPQSAFVEFERICRARMTVWLRELSERESDADLKLDYMGRVAAAAREFDIEGQQKLSIPAAANYGETNYRNFAQAVTGMITQLQIRSVRRIKESSVELNQSDKLKIEHHIQQIRARLADSGFDDKRRAIISSKLDALQAALDGKKLDLAKTLVLIASVATILNQSESALIKLPDAITAIMQIVGIAKENEKATSPMLPRTSTPLLIESRFPKAEIQSASFSRDEMDDEIPF